MSNYIRFVDWGIITRNWRINCKTKCDKIRLEKQNSDKKSRTGSLLDGFPSAHRTFPRLFTFVGFGINANPPQLNSLRQSPFQFGRRRSQFYLFCFFIVIVIISNLKTFASKI